MEKMKEVEKGRTREEFGAFVGILNGRRARPIVKEVSFVSVRILDSTVAPP